MPRRKKKASLIAIISTVAAFVTIVVGALSLSDRLRQFFVTPPAITTPLRGVVVDISQKPIAGAIITVQEVPARTVTTSDGGFFFPKIRGRPGDRARLFVRKPGFRDHDEYVTLPGPVRLALSRQ